MLQIMSPEQPKPISCFYTKLGGSHHYGFPYISRAYFRKGGISIPIRTWNIENTDLIWQTAKYGDDTQRNNGVVHKRLTGSISPTGVWTDGEKIAYQDTDGGLWIFAPGEYELITGILNSATGPITDYCVAAYGTTTYGYAVCTCYFSVNPGSTDPLIRDKTLSAEICVCDFKHMTGPPQSRRPQRGIYSRSRYHVDCTNVEIALDSAHSLVRQSLIYAQTLTGNRDNYVASPLTLNSLDISSDQLKQLNKSAGSITSILPYSTDSSVDIELYRDCLSGQNCFDGNGIAYAADLKKTGDSIRSILALIGNPRNPKAWASAWLALRYSDRLTYQDSVELLGSIKSSLASMQLNLSYKETRSVRSWTGTPTSPNFTRFETESRSRLRCDNDSYSGLMTSIKKLMDWDAWPTLENMWDLLPLSFVVDWFLNLSTILSNIDSMVYEQYLRVRFYERSDKTVSTLSKDYVARAFGLPSNRINCDVHGEVYYRREAARPQVGILDGWSPTSPVPKNLVDSAALLVQLRY